MGINYVISVIELKQIHKDLERIANALEARNYPFTCESRIRFWQGEPDTQHKNCWPVEWTCPVCGKRNNQNTSYNILP